MRRDVYPYLAPGGLIAAGRRVTSDSIRPSRSTWCSDDPRGPTHAARNLRLFSRRGEALDAAEALVAALGPTLAGAYLAVRRSEWTAYSAGDAAFEQQGHFEKY